MGAWINIDYLQLMTAHQKPRAIVTGGKPISRSLKAIAKELTFH